MLVRLLLEEEARVLVATDVCDGRTPGEVMLGHAAGALIVCHILKMKFEMNDFQRIKLRHLALVPILCR